MDQINQFSKTAESYIDAGLTNPYLMAVLKITIVLYAAQLAPRLPQAVSNVFGYTVTKLIALFVIVYISERDFQLAIILAVAFVIGSNLLSGRGVFESFANFSPDYKGDGKFTLIEPKSIIYPGCQSLTMNDLYNIFEGDNMRLQNTVEYAFRDLLSKATDKTAKEKLMKMAYATGLPYNVQFTDENAPLIGTILMYQGFNIGKDCHRPM